MAKQIKFPLSVFELCRYQENNVAVNMWHLKFKNLKFYLSLLCIYSISTGNFESQLWYCCYVRLQMNIKLFYLLTLRISVAL